MTPTSTALPSFYDTNFDPNNLDNSINDLLKSKTKTFDIASIVLGSHFTKESKHFNLVYLSNISGIQKDLDSQTFLLENFIHTY